MGWLWAARIPSPISLRTLLCSALGLGMLLVGEAARSQGSQEGGVQIQVRVTDQSNGQVLDGVRLELVRFPDGILQVGFSDGGGRGQFTSVPPNQYHIRASVMGYQPADVIFDPGAAPRGGVASYLVEVPMQRLASDSSPPPGGKVGTRELSLPPGAVTEFKKGIELLSEKKDPKGSIEHFQKAVDAYPSYYEAYYLMGMAHLQSSEIPGSVAAFQKSIEVNPKFLEPYYPLSSALHLLGRDTEAVGVLEKAMKLDNTGWRWPFELARLHGNRAEWDKALPLAREAATRKDAPPKVHLLLADLYANTGEPKKALEELETFAKLDPSSTYMPRVQATIEKLRQPN
jgi:hypothetical protein